VLCCTWYQNLILPYSSKPAHWICQYKFPQPIYLVHVNIIINGHLRSNAASTTGHYISEGHKFNTDHPENFNPHWPLCFTRHFARRKSCLLFFPVWAAVHTHGNRVAALVEPEVLVCKWSVYSSLIAWILTPTFKILRDVLYPELWPTPALTRSVQFIVRTNVMVVLNSVCNITFYVCLKAFSCLSFNTVGLLWYLWFSQRCFWVFRSSGIWVSESRRTSSGTTHPTTHRRIPKDLNVPIQMLWRQVYKYSFTGKWSGTATRLTMWNCSTSVEFYTAIISYFWWDAAISSVQVMLQCGWENGEVSLGKECGASRMHNLSRSTKRESLVVWWIGGYTANLIIRSSEPS